LHRCVDWQIADIVFIQLHGELLLERQKVQPARGGKSPIDQLVRNAVVQGIKKADVFTACATSAATNSSVRGAPAK
jgi:hypothetical protein